MKSLTSVLLALLFVVYALFALISIRWEDGHSKLSELGLRYNTTR